MTARAIEPRVLTGPHVRLVPLTEANHDGLRPLCRPETYATGYGGGPSGYRADPDECLASLWHGVEHNEAPYLVQLVGGPDDGAFVGTTSMYELDLPRETLVIGYTAYVPEVWGTVVNPECKLLLMREAFEHGFGRIEYRAAGENEHSRRAIAKLGATFEGLRRRDRPRPDGTWRDAAIFSIIDADWPAVEASLAARVAAAAEPVVLRR